MHYCSTHKQTPPHTHTHGAMDDNKYMYNCWYIPLVTHTIHAWAKGNNSNKITVTEQNSFIYLANSLGLWQSLVNTILSCFIKIYIAFIYLEKNCVRKLCIALWYTVESFLIILFMGQMFEGNQNFPGLAEYMHLG